MAPPFGSPGLQNSIEKWAKLRHAPPLPVGHQALGSKSPDFGRKWNEIWVKTFFFCCSPDFGRKMGRNLSVTISNSDPCSSQIFWSFCPPSFHYPAYATARLPSLYEIHHKFLKRKKCSIVYMAGCVLLVRHRKSYLRFWWRRPSWRWHHIQPLSSNKK